MKRRWQRVAKRRLGRLLRRLADRWDPTGSHRWLSTEEALQQSTARLAEVEARMDTFLRTARDRVASQPQQWLPLDEYTQRCRRLRRRGLSYRTYRDLVDAGDPALLRSIEAYTDDGLRRLGELREAHERSSRP